MNSESNDGSNLWHVLASGPHRWASSVVCCSSYLSLFFSDRPFVWSAELRALLKRVNEAALVRPSSCNYNRETALHVAVLSKAPWELIRFLCEKCRCPDIREAKNDKGETAFNYANRTKVSFVVCSFFFVFLMGVQASPELCEYLMVRK